MIKLNLTWTERLQCHLSHRGVRGMHLPNGRRVIRVCFMPILMTNLHAILIDVSMPNHPRLQYRRMIGSNTVTE